jgi:hypothetical protein
MAFGSDEIKQAKMIQHSLIISGETNLLLPDQAVNL